MVEALDALPLPNLSFQVNNRKLIQGFYRGLGIPDVTAAIRQIDKLDKQPAEAVAAAARRRGRRHVRSRRSAASSWRPSGSPTRRFVERVRALGVEDELLDEGLTELAAVIEGCASAVNDHVSVEANLRIARGLDYYTGTVLEVFMAGYERLKSVGGGGRYDALASDGRTTYPGVGVSFGVSRTLVPLFADGVLAPGPKVPSTVLVALVDEESRADQRGGRDRAAPPRHRHRGGRRPRRSSASRSGTPSAATSRTSGSRHRQRTRSRTSGAATRSPPTPTTWTHRGDRAVIRTHDAGSLRAEHAGQTVTLAGWVARRRDHGGVTFIDLREASGVVQVVVRDEAVAHQLRSEFCIKVTGEVGPAARGQRQPRAAHRRGRGRRRPSSRCSAPPRRCRSRSTTTSTWGRRCGSSTATSTCAVRRPTRRSGCAARSTRRPATSSTSTASSRSRRRR